MFRRCVFFSSHSSSISLRVVGQVDVASCYYGSSRMHLLVAGNDTSITDGRYSSAAGVLSCSVHRCESEPLAMIWHNIDSVRGASRAPIQSSALLTVCRECRRDFIFASEGRVMSCAQGWYPVGLSHVHVETHIQSAVSGTA